MASSSKGKNYIKLTGTSSLDETSKLIAKRTLWLSKKLSDFRKLTQKLASCKKSSNSKLSKIVAKINKKSKNFLSYTTFAKIMESSGVLFSNFLRDKIVIYKNVNVTKEWAKEGKLFNLLHETASAAEMMQKISLKDLGKAIYILKELNPNLKTGKNLFLSAVGEKSLEKYLKDEVEIKKISNFLDKALLIKTNADELLETVNPDDSIYESIVGGVIADYDAVRNISKNMPAEMNTIKGYISEIKELAEEKGVKQEDIDAQFSDFEKNCSGIIPEGFAEEAKLIKTTTNEIAKELNLDRTSLDVRSLESASWFFGKSIDMILNSINISKDGCKVDYPNSLSDSLDKYTKKIDRIKKSKKIEHEDSNIKEKFDKNLIEAEEYFNEQNDVSSPSIDVTKDTVETLIKKMKQGFSFNEKNKIEDIIKDLKVEAKGNNSYLLALISKFTYRLKVSLEKGIEYVAEIRESCKKILNFSSHKKWDMELMDKVDTIVNIVGTLAWIATGVSEFSKTAGWIMYAVAGIAFLFNLIHNAVKMHKESKAKRAAKKS